MTVQINANNMDCQLTVLVQIQSVWLQNLQNINMYKYENKRRGRFHIWFGKLNKRMAQGPPLSRFPSYLKNTEEIVMTPYKCRVLSIFTTLFIISKLDIRASIICSSWIFNAMLWARVFRTAGTLFFKSVRSTFSSLLVV